MLSVCVRGAALVVAAVFALRLLLSLLRLRRCARARVRLFGGVLSVRVRTTGAAPCVAVLDVPRVARLDRDHKHARAPCASPTFVRLWMSSV